MASCFGILGVGGEIFAKDYRCDNNNITYNGRTANDLCAGGIWGDDCDDENNYDYAFCVENNQKSVQFGCKKGWGGMTCDCSFIKVDDCPNGCVNGKCKMSSTPPATACESVSGQVCCDEKDCSGFVASGPRECSSGFCCKEKYCKCESVSGQICCDLRTNNCSKVVFEGPRECSSGTCCQPESCVPKTQTCSDAGGSCCDLNKNTCSQEKLDVSGCSGSRVCCIGQCNPISTTTPNPCYWINIGCNPDDECDNQEAEICGPSSCEGTCNGKSKGKIRCVSGSDCNEGGGGTVNNGGGMGGSNTGGSGGAVRFNNPLSTDSFEALIMGIINWILGIVVSLAILFLIIGGLMYITSAGDEERIKKAKNIILYAVVGLGVVILSWSIITELKDILGVQ